MLRAEGVDIAGSGSGAEGWTCSREGISILRVFGSVRLSEICFSLEPWESWTFPTVLVPETEDSQLLAVMADSDEVWVAWEPPVDRQTRPQRYMESEHFACRYGSDGVVCPSCCSMLSCAGLSSALFCDHPDFVSPTRRAIGATMDSKKLNIYIGDTGLHPSKQRWVGSSRRCREVWKAAVAGMQPRGKLHHSCWRSLRLPARHCARTGHVQMHTGGHIDSEGYQWEAHAGSPLATNPEWAPHVPIYLRTSFLPIDCTNYDGPGEGAGRQYIVWPFYAYMDKVYGRGTAHLLWHTDRQQRQRTGRSRDMISNLIAETKLLHETVPGRPAGFGALFGAYARASLTLDWARSDASEAQARRCSRAPILWIACASLHYDGRATCTAGTQDGVGHQHREWWVRTARDRSSAVDSAHIVSMWLRVRRR